MKSDQADGGKNVALLYPCQSRCVSRYAIEIVQTLRLLKYIFQPKTVHACVRWVHAKQLIALDFLCVFSKNQDEEEVIINTRHFLYQH